MSVGILFEGEISIPPDILTLEQFRHWALSDDFPEQGRIDFVRGLIEVELMPERLSSHGAVKVEIARVLANLVHAKDLGNVYIDQTRVSSPLGDVSSEPDILVVLHETIDSGAVRLVPSKDGTDFVEIEGGPDLVVEIVSPSSVGKDTLRLPPAYFDAGVREYWLIDARRELSFTIFHRGEMGFVEASRDPQGFMASRVLDRRYRLDRELGRREEWRYDLKEERSV